MTIHSFDIKEAEKYGILGAVLLHHIRFWVQKNAANRRHYHDGKYWTYNSVTAFSELFPYATKDQIRRALDKLEDLGALETGSYSDNHYDRTKWFTCNIELANLPNQFVSDAKSLTNTDIKPDISAPSAKKEKNQTLPNGFALEEDMRAYAVKNGIRNIESTFEHFVDHHKSKGSKFADWKAAWRNWVRNAKNYQPANQQQKTAANYREV